MGLPASDVPASVTGRRVFAANGVTFTVADLVPRTGLGDREPFPGLVSADLTAAQVEEAFRRGRGLLRADQLEAWLASWVITPDDFRRWTEDAATGSRTATGWCRLLCSGAYDAAVAEVVSAAAAACALGHPPSDPATFDPRGWTSRLVADRLTLQALAEVIAEHRLDWTSVEVDCAEAGERSVAEELRHQVLSDGRDLGAAAAGAGCTATRTTDVLAGLPAAVRSALAGARVGDLLGPLPLGAGFVLLHLRGRQDPTLDQEATRSRAEALLQHRVIADAVARHVVA